MLKPNLFLIAIVALVLASAACKKPNAPVANSAQQPQANTTAPKLLKKVHASFPKDLWNKPGTVAVAVLVKEDGKVGEVRVVQSPHPELNQLAIDAVKQWEFDPARKDGKPVISVITIGVNFQPPVPGQGDSPSTSAQPAKK